MPVLLFNHQPLILSNLSSYIARIPSNFADLKVLIVFLLRPSGRALSLVFLHCRHTARRAVFFVDLQLVGETLRVTRRDIRVGDAMQMSQCVRSVVMLLGGDALKARDVG